jgi:hypothetical protein
LSQNLAQYKNCACDALLFTFETCATILIFVPFDCVLWLRKCSSLKQTYFIDSLQTEVGVLMVVTVTVVDFCNVVPCSLTLVYTDVSEDSLVYIFLY